MSENSFGPEALQRVIDFYAAYLLITGDLHASGIQISRSGIELTLSGPALEREIKKIVKL